MGLGGDGCSEGCFVTVPVPNVPLVAHSSAAIRTDTRMPENDLPSLQCAECAAACGGPKRECVRTLTHEAGNSEL